MNYKQWCIEQHEKTNHFYHKYLPYRFHLEMVNDVYEEFKYLLDDTVDYFTKKVERDIVTLRTASGRATWGHDLVEDCRVSYNDCVKVLGREAADIIYAVTNLRGKTREERANDEYYDLIRKTDGATFVKLCDRIGNVRFGTITKSTMFERYEKENPNFIDKVGADLYPPMKECLIKLFETPTKTNFIL